MDATNLMGKMLEALQSWERHATGNGYSKLPNSTAYLPILKSTRDLIAKADVRAKVVSPSVSNPAATVKLSERLRGFEADIWSTVKSTDASFKKLRRLCHQAIGREARRRQRRWLRLKRGAIA